MTLLLNQVNPLLRVSNLRTYFDTENGPVKSVDGVSFHLSRGETLAVVGESGSGKSVTSLSIMRLISHPGRIVGGEIWLTTRDGKQTDIAQLSPAEILRLRGNEIAMIFQEPMTSLNPVYKIGDQISESIVLHQSKSKRQALELAVNMLELVGIAAPRKRISEYPHQLSGGMRQRVMIAMALSCNPSVLIADEPTTALDVTVQAQILDLMRKLQREVGMGILFVTHNLGVVAEMADRVLVMYSGLVVEESTTLEIFRKARHPYTLGLLNSIPKVGRGRLEAIGGSMPSAQNMPPGCPFEPRCKFAIPECTAALPALEDTGGGHLSRCIRWRDL